MKNKVVIIPTISIHGTIWGWLNQISKKSMVVLGDEASGKTALLWQLGLIKDKSEDLENGYDPKDYRATGMNPNPVKVDFRKKNGVRISSYQDTSGTVEQRMNGGYSPLIKQNDIIVIVFDGNKFLSELEQNIKDNYVKNCNGIFRRCYDEVQEYNSKWYHPNKKQIKIIASHLDKYIASRHSSKDMKLPIQQWAAKWEFKSLFDEANFACLTLNDATKKHNTQEIFFNKLLKQ